MLLNSIHLIAYATGGILVFNHISSELLMRLKNLYSIIELMTVILVILLLISLITPIFVNLKMNARTALCKGHLRQIGVLLTAYQSDENGYLPNDDAFRHHVDGAICPYNCGQVHISGDIKNPDVGNNAFYQNWNGHLLPYMDLKINSNYTRYAMVTKVGSTRFDSSQLGGPMNPPPADVLKDGWALVDDAYQVGGHQDLKSFICPEIHQNTFDVAASLTFNGIKIPRIAQLCTGGPLAFKDVPGYDYQMTGGVPTTYLANNVFFGAGIGKNSKRVDDFIDISQKAFLIEGGIADAYGTGANGEAGGVYYGVDGWNGRQFDGGDLSVSGILYQTAAGIHKLSYVHDNQTNFWVMNSKLWGLYFPNMNRDFGMDVATKFNAHYAGKAYMASGTNTSGGFIGFSIVSYIYPGEKGETFDEFFKALSVTTPTNYLPFIDEPNDFHYLVGNMNVLFGDGSVFTKDQGWLCNNRRQIGQTTME